jgi:hypothetical protein
MSMGGRAGLLEWGGVDVQGWVGIGESFEGAKGEGELMHACPSKMEINRSCSGMLKRVYINRGNWIQERKQN